jgi:hypothetical protein
MDFLFRSIEEHSLLWMIISAGLGGVVGAMIKFIFETVIASRYQNTVSAKKMLRRYRYPLLRAADSLDRRLENMIRFVNKQWYDDDKDDYYRLSTLYLFGTYLGWCKILEDSAYFEFERSDRHARQFSRFFYRVFKSLTGFGYFKGVPAGEVDDVEAATVPRFALTAIGELMYKKPQGADQLPETLTFIEFTARINTSAEFKKWFQYLESGLLSHQKGQQSSARWNRLLVMSTLLRIFVSYLDPHGRQTAPRQIEYLQRMHPKVAEKVRAELVEMDMDDLLVEPE